MRRQKRHLWMLIPTYYLLSKNWDIFATRCCILLIFNPNYFRGGKIDDFKVVNENCNGLSTDDMKIVINNDLTIVNCYRSGIDYQMGAKGTGTIAPSERSSIMLLRKACGTR